MLKLYDVAPDGTAVMFDEQVSLVKSGRMSVDLKATDWTLAAGHVLAVEIGSIQTGSWRDTPSGETVEVKGPGSGWRWTIRRTTSPPQVTGRRTWTRICVSTR